MVRGKTQATKVPITKKPSASNKGIAVPSTSTPGNRSHSKPSQFAAVPSCCGCGIVITDDTKALQCDRCMSPTIWKCSECLHITDDMYDQLVTDPKVSLRWFCENCDKIVADQTLTAASAPEGKLDNLITLVEKMICRYENIEQKLSEKCDVGEMTKLESRIKQLEDKLSYLEPEVDQRFHSIEHRLPTTTTTGPSGNYVEDEEMIKLVVQEELNKKTESDKDSEARKHNIIVYRIPEKKLENVAERKANDEVFVKDLLDGVFNVKLQDGDIEKMYRLGRWAEDKARPLLISFRDIELKHQIMANLRNLKQPIDRFRGIGISQDLHPKERQENKRLIDEAKRTHDETDLGKVENFRFLVVGSGQRRRVITIKKN